jgi:hypothetical protein
MTALASELVCDGQCHGLALFVDYVPEGVPDILVSP